MREQLFIGLMSGTSIDSIDAVIVDFARGHPELIAHHTLEWPQHLRLSIRALGSPGDNEIDRLGMLDVQAAEQFAEAVRQLLAQSGVSKSRIRAVGSHGQTVRHRPEAATPFTLQIGDPNRIAELTGITVVADFRRRDMAAGGQGAPLVPAFHAALFGRAEESRVAMNLGGIANITLLPGRQGVAVSGFDTGPANTLLDAWSRRHLEQPLDEGGTWAAQGTPCQPLLERMLADPYFRRLPPKSTGTEHFNLDWLDACLAGFPESAPVDVQATLLLLTAQTVSEAILRHAPHCRRVIASGGGVRNGALMEKISGLLAPIPVELSDGHGIAAEQVEAAAFAWLARQTLQGESGNLPSVTGASHAVILGGIYPGGPLARPREGRQGEN
jgi:anhydro-N-acetylmuramic acid kinase